ncbi:tetratricopeptide repeat protein [Rhodoferax sp.]|uniref:nuclear transport factor 2 family protein n=1 Tax=Rhodoferax sp. TaxID=50421 RepID=UPI0028468956|nr:tetratricopeptide repeat protein [Rhodoferax sp.]MDR3369589.1 tetratricopeptide repeat protein [Rhodoferax sp.]
MKQAPNALYKSLRLLLLAGACVAASAYADEYADVTQLMRANKFAEALTRVNTQLATKPADPQMRFFKGVIQRNLGKSAEAISTFTQLTQDYPELPEPYNNLAVLYASQGQYDKARLALEMAIRTNPSYATAHENLGDVYARLASQAYNKALQLDSSNTAVPPKLELIGELFKTNLSGAHAPGKTSVVAAATEPAVKPVAPAVAPSPAVKPSVPVVTASTPVAVAAATSKANEKASVTPAASNSLPKSVTPDAQANKAVEAAVLAWAKSWSEKNTAAYLKAYSADFQPAGKQTRGAWEKERHQRIDDKKDIAVTITDLVVHVKGDQAIATFHQAYKADHLSVTSRKTLDLKNVAQHWLITREAVGR